MSSGPALPPAGWYPDSGAGTEVQRYWDGSAWTTWVLRDGVPTDVRAVAMPSAVTAPVIAVTAPVIAVTALATANSAASTVGSFSATAGQLLQGGAGWQVVIGPRLPVFPPLTVEGLTGAVIPMLGGSLLRAIRNPVVSLAVTSILSLGPAFLAAAQGADLLLWVRAVLAVGAVVAALVGPRLAGRARLLTVAGPAVFAVAQLVAMGMTALDLANGRAGLGAALPALVSGLATVLVAALVALRARPR